MNPPPSRLLVITDRHQARRPLPEVVAACLDGGADWILFRERDLPAAERLTLGRAVAAEVRSRGGKLSVGGDPDLAGELGADGVQVQSPEAVIAARAALEPSVLIGLSAHSVADCRAAAGAGADYVTLSPVFASSSKPGYGPALGVDVFAGVTGLPVFGLAGITPSNARACLEAGAAGVAVMGEAMRADDPAAVCRALLQALG